MKHAYVLRVGNFDASLGEYRFYDIEVFTSAKKLRAAVANRIKVNKGYEVDYELTKKEDYKNEWSQLVNYKCLSSDGREMKIRYELLKKVAH